MSTNTKRTRFSRRLPDHVTDELVSALSKPVVYEFNQLFAVVYENLKLRNAVSGGEEMLRLRAYEKLQGLVSRGLVERTGMAQEKRYRGLENIKISQLPPPMPVRPSVVLEAVRKVEAEERALEEARVAAAAAAEAEAAEAAAAAELAAAEKAQAKAKTKAKAAEKAAGKPAPANKPAKAAAAAPVKATAKAENKPAAAATKAKVAPAPKAKPAAAASKTKTAAAPEGKAKAAPAKKGK